MEYPGTHFKRPLRRVFLITFIVAFCLITPVIVMSTMGYRYDWQRGLLKETGSISVDITPKNASVYLNGSLIKGSLPIRLSNIVPRHYQLKITTPGYYDWAKDIEVINKQTVYIKDVELLKKDKPALIQSGQIQNIALSPSGRYLAIAYTQNKNLTVTIRDTVTDAATELPAAPSAIQAVKLTWSKKNDYLALSDSEPPYHFLRVIKASEPGTTHSISEDGDPQITKYQWTDSNGGSLFFSTPTFLQAYSVFNGQTTNIVQNKFTDWFLEQNNLWTLTAATSTNAAIITRDSLGFSSIFATLITPPAATAPTWNIVAAQNDTVLIQSQNHELTLVTANKQFPLSTTNFVLSPFQDWWLLWSTWELWGYSNAGEPYLVSRSGNELREIVALDKNNTLGIGWADKIVAFYPYYSVEQELTKSHIKSLTTDTDKRILYYFDEKGLWKLNY